MAKAGPVNIVEELGVLLSGDALEDLLEELADPGSRLTVGQAARFFSAMEAVAARGMQAVRDQMVGVQLHTDRDVLFQWQSPSEQMRVDTTEVKNLFPPSAYPNLYKVSEVKGSVKITLPFDKRRALLPESF